jgi:hypothetical protein
MVLRFISTLLRANRNQQNEFYSKQIPKGIFRDNRPEVSWVYSYRDKFGFYPSISAFKHRFPNSVLPKTRESVETAVQSVLDSDLYSQVTGTVNKAKDMYSSGRAMSEVAGFIRESSAKWRTYDASYVDYNVSDSDLVFKRYSTRVKQRIAGSLLIPSPWPFLNNLIAYSEPGEHNVLASRTSVGKSWVGLEMAEHYRKNGLRVLIITKEMPTYQLAERYECLTYKLDYPAFRKGYLKPADLARWKFSRKDNPRENIIISGQETLEGVGFGHITTKIQQHRPDALVVDGAYLIWPEGFRYSGNMVDRFTMISNTMKRLCKYFSLIGWSIIQVKREAENREGDTDASLKDIYGADVWAQDSDNVVLISGKRGSTLRKVKLAKGRESNVGEFNIHFRLSPFPFFRQAHGITTNNNGKVRFKGI